MINITYYTFETTLKNTLLPVFITYKTLSYNELITCYNKSIIKDKFNKKYYQYLIVNTSVIDEDKQYIDKLNEKDYNQLFELILEKSKVKENLLENIEKIFTIYSDKNLQNNTWDCENCKARNLHYSRNCPIEDVPQNDDFSYIIKGEVYKTCPIGETLKYQTEYNNAISSYNLYKKGLLPNTGGFYDQTEFFILTSKLLDGLISKYEQEELDRMNKT